MKVKVEIDDSAIKRILSGNGIKPTKKNMKLLLKLWGEEVNQLGLQSGSSALEFAIWNMKENWL